jgi:energy-coupling factor transport system permease protein
LIITPRYLGRGSWLARRDPRVPILIGVMAALGVIQVWDARIAIVLLVLALTYYRTAHIPWRAVRRQWAFALTFVSFLVILNTILTTGEISSLDPSTFHTLFTIPGLGTKVSAESLSYGATQMLRFITFIAVGFPLAYAIAPADLGVALARLGIPGKFAFGVDLTWRFMPSLAADLQETVDAQRVRGYEWDRGGPMTKLRRSVPLVVPLTMNAIVGAEDTIDAMDLRAFGATKRTWLRHLVFDRADRLLLLITFAIFATVTILGFGGNAKLFVFPFLLPA